MSPLRWWPEERVGSRYGSYGRGWVRLAGVCHGKTAAAEVIEDINGEGTLWLVYLPSSIVQENNSDFGAKSKTTVVPGETTLSMGFRALAVLSAPIGQCTLG